jgi:hypothetical protein
MLAAAVGMHRRICRSSPYGGGPWARLDEGVSRSWPWA